MIADKRVLAVIPARGGSKGLPGKNTRLLSGKPLIAWSIEAARGSKYVDRCVISTEDPVIADCARHWNGDVPFMRPDALATDEARIEDAILDVLARLDESYDFLVLLQPTSPLRIAADIDACLELCVEKAMPASLTMAPPAKSPYWMFERGDDARIKPLLGKTQAARRQELPPVFALNGAVYVAEVAWFTAHRTFLSEETLGHVMPIERSIDIDSILDFRMAELLAAAQ